MVNSLDIRTWINLEIEKSQVFLLSFFLSIFCHLFCETAVASYVFLSNFAREISSWPAGIDPLTHARRLITGLATIGSVSVKRRLQTTDYRTGLKCRLRVKCRLKTAEQGKMQTWFRLWLQYWPDCEAQERSVEHLEASDTKHHSKITLTFSAQNKGTRNRFLLSK